MIKFLFVIVMLLTGGLASLSHQNKIMHQDVHDIRMKNILLEGRQSQLKQDNIILKNELIRTQIHYQKFLVKYRQDHKII